MRRWGEGGVAGIGLDTSLGWAAKDCDTLLMWEKSGQNAMYDVVDIVAFIMETVQLARDRVASSWIRWVVYAGAAAVVVLAAAELWAWL